MTNLEALRRFSVHYDAIASTSAPPVEELEISTFMNTAMMELVGAYGNARLFDKLLEITSIENKALVACTLEDYGNYAFQAISALDYTLLYFVNAHLKVSGRTSLVTINNDWIPCEQITKNIAWYYVQSPMNKQIILYPKVLIHYDDVSNYYNPIVFTDSHTSFAVGDISSFQIVYIRKPSYINLDSGNSAPLCELSEEAQELIVKRSVKYAIESTDQDRLKLAVDQQQRQQQQSR